MAVVTAKMDKCDKRLLAGGKTRERFIHFPPGLLVETNGQQQQEGTVDRFCSSNIVTVSRLAVCQPGGVTLANPIKPSPSASGS